MKIPQRSGGAASEWCNAILRISIAVALIVGGALVLLQERLIFFPTKLSSDYRFSFAVPFSELFIDAEAERMHALYFPNPRDKGVILYFHGNGGALDTWGDVAADLVRISDFGVLMLDYPGYGKSPGAITSESQLHALAAAAFARARHLAGGSERVVIFGRSIGTGLAAKLAADHPQVAGLILETPFMNLRELAALHFPWAPLFLLKYQFRSDQSLPKVERPILILHGTRDEVIPFDQGYRLSKLAKSVTFVEIPGGHHNDLSAHPGYESALREFLAKLPAPRRKDSNNSL